MKLARLIPIVVLVTLSMLAGCSKTAQTPSPPAEEVRTESAQQVDVELGEWYVKLTPSTVNAGTVEFNIRNVGKSLHALELEKGNFEEKSKSLAAGESGMMTVELEAGEYEAYCPIGRHKDSGMETKLTVK